MKQIAQALNKFQSNLPEVKLDATVKVQTKTGGSYNFKYATYANIVKTVLPPLIENNMAFTQTFGDGCLITSLFHISGESIESKIPINLDGCTMQEIGSRISYLKRYSLSAILGIVAEEDDDANIADGNSYQKQPRKATQKSNPEKTGDDQMSEPQLKYIKGCGEKLGLTKDDTWGFMKWIAEQNEIDPKHRKMSKLILPENKFNTEYAKYTQREIEGV